MDDYALRIAEHRPMLLRLARRRLRNDTWAEDAVSETLVAALENPAAFTGRAQLGTWLAGILKHKLVDQVRRHARECALADGGDGDDGSELDPVVEAAGEAPAEWCDPLERLARRQFMTAVDRCLQELPPRQGRAFVLREGVGADTDAICRELGISANNLGVMLHRARVRLRAALQPHWGGAMAQQG